MNDETMMVEQAKRHNIDVMETMLNSAREMRTLAKRQIEHMHAELEQMDQTIAKLDEELAKLRAG